MKKIIFLDRVKQGIIPQFFDELSEHEIITAYSNEDALKVHKREKAALIVTELYGSGMNGVEFCSRLREDADLRGVSVIMFCRDNEVELEEAARCRANAVLTLPVQRALLREHILRLLSISFRGSYHVSFSAQRAGSRGATVDCRTENISVSGMLIAANAELLRGETLRYSLELPPHRSFLMQAEVVRADAGTPSDRRRYGVRFSQLDPAARHAIEILVSREHRP